MRIFEFQFNPKAKQDSFFKVASFEPAKEEQQERGNMYIVGELTKALPSNSALLDRLSAVLRQEYYGAEKPNQSASQRLKGALKKANTFLEEETKSGNVDWLGNLRFLLLLLVPVSRQGGSALPSYTLYFTKVGDIKLWMARNGSLVDAGKSVEAAKKDDGSSKIFGNVGSGKVVAQDRIIAVTQEVFDFFSKENFLQTLVQLKEEKQLKSLFKSKAKEMSLISGVFFFMLVEALQPAKERNQDKQSLPIPQLKLPSLPRKIPYLTLASIASKSWWPNKPSLSIPMPGFAKKRPAFLKVSDLKKRMGLFALFLFVLFLGFAILGGLSEKAPNIQEVSQPDEMSEELLVLNKITKIAEPKIAAELNTSLAGENFQRIIQKNSRFYFFRPGAQRISFLDTSTNTSEILNTGKNLKLGTSFQGSLFFFAEPETIVSVDGQNTVLQHTIASLPAELRLEGMEQFAGNLYFFDSRNGEIFKSPFPSTGQVSLESWVDPLSSKKPINARSIGVDGSIWILTAENEIQRYFKGKYVESLDPEIFPAFQNAMLLKVDSQLPYLYILEPQEKRIVVLSKSGEVIAQYRSEAFAHVHDFVVSLNGQMIYLFDGAKIYLISPSYELS